jgi:hypothetical protein
MPELDDNPIAAARGRTRAELTLSLMWNPSQDYSELILKKGLFLTKDEHRDDGIYPLPDTPHLRALYRELFLAEQEGVPVLIPKSRQMQITWGVDAYLLARGLTRRNQLIILQTKREDDAGSLMERITFMYEHLPQWLKSIRPRVTGLRENRYKVEIPCLGNKIWGIPQGAEIIRSNTVSVFFSDEVDFQPDGRASVRAAMPSVAGGGLAIFVSTAVLDGLMPKLMTGTW